MKLTKTNFAAVAAALFALEGGGAKADVVPYGNAPLIVQRQHPIYVPESPIPAIHGSSKLGCTPGHVFFYRVPATGSAPLTFKAAGLPAGVKWDPATGTISGSCSTAQTCTIKITASNAKGAAFMDLTLVCAVGSLALTPPMGWTPLGLYGETEDDTKIRNAADALNSTGLAAHGWRTVIVDDSWQATRSQSGEIVPNRRFPDMKGLGAYIHSKGLQFGLYSAPTQHSCSGYTGSLGHEAQDAATFAGWGIDYLKYEWCPVDIDTEQPPSDIKAAFTLMHDRLVATNRDIVYGISTNGREFPGSWASDAGANSFTVEGVIPDDWTAYVRKTQLYYGLVDNSSISHWMDPGPLLVGRSDYGNVHQSNFTPSEQMYQMSLLCLLPAPLFLNCDLDRLDPNKLNKSTTAMLTNDEVIAIDQDALGIVGQPLTGGNGTDVWFKPLADGTIAVGIFNRSDIPRQGTVNFSDISLSGPQPVRDLWLHKALPAATDSFTADVPPHGVVLVKIGKPQVQK